MGIASVTEKGKTMSNSKMVCYTKLSPNCNKPRNHKIDMITIHCMAGNLSVETCGAVFAPTSRQASSNYGIGSDGRVGLYVDEANRSWCTSSAANDHRAVTIEVANTVAAHPWPVSDKALAALIDLCEDICRRNDIKQLLWRGDKNLFGDVSKQNMSAHRWFAAKACPGDHLYNLHAHIANEVNKRLSGGSVQPAPVVPVTAAEKTIWDFLKVKGLNNCAISGVMGNLYAESGLAANNLQNTYNTKFGLTDAEYTEHVDNRRFANFVKDSAGYGLAQWTFWSRKEALLKYAQSQKKSIGDITMQLEFLWTEMQGYKDMMTVLKGVTTVRAASDVFLLQFEKPADQSEAVKVKRAGYAQGYYNKFVNGTQSGEPAQPVVSFPYEVRVTADTLNVRKGPGTNYAVAQSITDKGIYTITEEANGAGATKWGKLKSGAGWISLDFCTKR